MKSKLLIMGVLCAIAFKANAQTEKGKNLINGTVGFISNKSESNSSNLSTTNQKSTLLNFSPSYGYFVSNNLAIGLGIGYSQNKTDYNGIDLNSSSFTYNTQTLKQHNFSINPFVRKYVNIADKFNFFGQFKAGIGFGKSESKSIYEPASITSENNYKTTSYNASLSPGFVFFPSKKWGIEFSFPLLAYDKSKPKDETTNSNAFNSETFTFVTSSFNPNIGFSFHF